MAPFREILEEAVEQAEQESYKLNGTPQETPSQIDMVEAAIEAGRDKPKDGVAFIKQKFGVDVDPRYFGVAKGNLKKRDSNYQPRTRATPLPLGQAPAQSGIPAGFGTDIRTIKGLIEKAGSAEELSELVGDIAALVGKYGEGGLQELIQAFG